MEAAQVSISIWMDEEDVHLYAVEPYLAIPKEWPFVIRSNMDGPRRYYAKRNKSDKKTNAVWYHWHADTQKKQKTSECNKREHRLKNELAATSGEEEHAGGATRARRLRCTNHYV